MATNNRERIGSAFDYLSEGLYDPVNDVMSSIFRTPDWNTLWAQRDQQKYGNDLRILSKKDVQVQLRAITEFGREFSGMLSRAQQSYASELRETRNRWAHTQSFSSDETIRALSTIELLLEAMTAPDSAADVRKLRDQLQRTVYEDHTRKQSQHKIISVDPIRGMKSWRTVIAPHKDVAQGNFTAAEFAADLYQVAVNKHSQIRVPGNAYGDPVEFFNRTYLTEGLKDLLSRAMRRLVGDGSGSPVVDLQTNFGGGKTHSMLALYHLFGERPLTDLSDGIQALARDISVKPWEPGRVRRVSIVGNYLDVASPSIKDDGTEVHTIWGELAWQLGGKDAYELVRESDTEGTPPAETLDKLIRAYSPCLILVDEWVAYARQLVNRDDLPAGTFDSQFTFAQTLTEVASAVPGCMLVVSIPASEDGERDSENEVGGSNGKKALDALRNVVGRKADQWRPSTKDESFEIVRKRLFEEPNAEQQESIALTARLFVEMYRSNRDAYPAEASAPGNEYEKRIRASYPLHPELLDRLYEDWSSLERFQRTRGVLKLVSSIISELWQSEDSSPLILPGNVPLDATSVNTDLTGYLPDSWKPVIEADVDGPTSTAARIDNERTVLGSRHLTQRIARTVFIGSAPRANMPNKGISNQNTWLGTAIPGDAQGNFGTAIGLLEQRSTYFFAEESRYRYSLQPSVAKTARDFAEQYREDSGSVFNEIAKRLEKESMRGNRGKFLRVCVAPNDSSLIPDVDEATLVIVPPQQSVSKGESESSPTIQWIREAIERRGTAQRMNRNMVIFLAADSNAIEVVQGTTRSYLGWKRVVDTEASLNLTSQQLSQAQAMADRYSRSLNDQVRSAYNWCLYPEQFDPTNAYAIKQSKVPESGGDSLAERVSSKLLREDALIENYQANNIANDILSSLKTAFVDGAISVKTVWEYVTQFPYMPRLTSRNVFDRAIQGVPSLAMVRGEQFALAAERFPDTGWFRNLIIPGVTEPTLSDVHVTDSTLIVDWDVAMDAYEKEKQQRDADKSSHVDETYQAFVSSGDYSKSAASIALGDDELLRESAPVVRKRFFGKVRLNPDTLNRDLARINEQILDQLRLAGGQLSISLEISAVNSNGYSEDAIKTIESNSSSLHLDDSGFEEE